MGNEEADGHMIRLGDWDVLRSSLEEPGTGWYNVVAGRVPQERILPKRAGADFPLTGWRVVHAASEPWAAEVLILAAPSTTSPGRWVLIQLALGPGGWYLASPWSQLPVPVHAVRRQGLRLEWAQPGFTAAEGAKPLITVVLVNDSDAVWQPTEADRSHVQGVAFSREGNRIGNGWYASGLTEQLPSLGPGEQAFLPAFLNNPELEGLPKGSYQLMATLTALDLRVGTRAALTVT